MDRAYLTKEEKFLFREGTWYQSFDRLGAHPLCKDGCDGYEFAVWAPGAKAVYVTGTFNEWNQKEFSMDQEVSCGIWHLFVPRVRKGDLYKFVIETETGALLYKADPYAFYTEKIPGNSSRIEDIDGYKWQDALWLARRKKNGHMNRPLNIYEVHLGSWKRHEDGSYYTYKELAEELIPYAVRMGYTHLELMPVMEHPYDGSWGYQITGYYAPTSRFGEPKDFMAFVDKCHGAGLGVILDWVPGHFCRDAHGLGAFVGDKLFEKGDHQQWGTYKFDFGKGEVRSFLISNLLFWLEKYHADGIRVDGVTSMLYLNFGIGDINQKEYNQYGKEENLEAIDFIRAVNNAAAHRFPDVMMIAEESTAWPLVTYPPADGGLGFHYKWDMGWMNDTLHYMKTDFPFRPGNHGLLTFTMMYAFNENFILPLSHDEVVHGKCSLIVRMPGDYWRQFAGLRLLALYQICHPGAKLNFMGNEIGQFIEWREYEGIEWFLTDYEAHQKHQYYIEALNGLYKEEKALWQKSYSWEGFHWLDADNDKQSILSFVRQGKKKADDLIVLLNFRPDTYTDYRVGVTKKGTYKEIFNSDYVKYGGSGNINGDFIESEALPWHGMNHSIRISVPPIGGVILKRCGKTHNKIDDEQGEIE